MSVDWPLMSLNLRAGRRPIGQMITQLEYTEVTGVAVDSGNTEVTGGAEVTERRTRRTRVVGSSDEIRHVEHEALLAARGDANVLITGEPGVGKSMLARYIHENSDRSPMGFAMIKCTGLPDILFESELFGHLKGSFVGAYRDKTGLLELTAGGTILLEEVSALSLGMQARLLRYLETGEYRRIGGDRVQFQSGPDIRFIVSTSASLPVRVAAGLFLDDLYGRLSAAYLTVPPLRERRDDIPSLVDHFVGDFAGQFGGGRSADISDAVTEMLTRAEWPGNVQELKTAVLRQLLLGSVRSSGSNGSNGSNGSSGTKTSAA